MRVVKHRLNDLFKVPASRRKHIGRLGTRAFRNKKVIKTGDLTAVNWIPDIEVSEGIFTALKLGIRKQFFHPVFLLYTR